MPKPRYTVNCIPCCLSRLSNIPATLPSRVLPPHRLPVATGYVCGMDIQMRSGTLLACGADVAEQV